MIIKNLTNADSKAKFMSASLRICRIIFSMLN